jgi:RNase adapter protein RapZ
MTPAAKSRRRRGSAEILVITGLSGSGKTHVMRALEDAGWFCVDNLPTALIPPFADLIRNSPDLRRSALVVDVRERDFVRRLPVAYRAIRARGVKASLLFLEADSRVLMRRFSETRRPHPMALDEPVTEGIKDERLALARIRKMADRILDTSAFTVHELRDYVMEHYERRPAGQETVISILSFGFKHGLPAEADLVFDVRFLPNPNFVPALRRLTGLQAPVVRYMKAQPDTAKFLKKLLSFLGFVIPRYVKEGKSYLTVAIGCTGGRHRSVMLASALGAALVARGYAPRVRHRDVKLR